MSLDYRDAKYYKSSTDAEKAENRVDGGVDCQWWETSNVAERVKAFNNVCISLKQNSQDRKEANLRHARLYENVELDSLSGGDYATAVVRQALLGSGIMRLNVTAAAVDTLAAKIGKNNPRPTFLTSGGNWPMQQKARRLNQFSQGFFYETKFKQVAERILFDAFIFGTGLGYLYKGEDGRIEFERVIPDEIYVDDSDAHYGAPRTMYRRKTVNKDVLASIFPDQKDAIHQASGPDDQKNVTSKGAVPCVEVWEAWHLPSGQGKSDGKHVIMINDAELLCEPWKLQKHPFVTIRFKKRTVGFWGKGVVESLTGIQLELNRLVGSISEQLRRKGRNQVFLQYGSKVNPEKITNNIGDIIWYTGAPPTFNNQNAVSAEDYMQVDRLYQRAFQEVGISELSASAKKPSGLDAAVALREYSDIESERFALTHIAWEQFSLDFAELGLELISKQYGSEGYKIRLPSKRFVIEVDWSDINLDRDSYVMQCFPTSSLPSTPAARYQKVREMLNDGMIDMPTAQRLLEFPDLQAETNLGNAAIDDADATISAIIDEEKPTLLPFEPYQNADLIISRATAMYLYARHHGCDERRLGMLRDLIDQTTAAKAAMMAPPPMAPDAMGASMGPNMPAQSITMPDQNVTVNNNQPAAPVAAPVIG